MKTMSSHLPILREMFPSTLLLNVDQVASVLVKAPRTISDWYYKDQLPFKVVHDPDGLRVSIIELANYLDACLTEEGGFLHKPRKAKKQDLIEMPTIKPKVIGRPRGTRKYDKLFKAQLGFAVMSHLVQNELGQLEKALDEFIVAVDDKVVMDEVSAVKDEMLADIKRAKASLQHTYLTMTLGKKIDQTSPKNGKLKV